MSPLRPPHNKARFAAACGTSPICFQHRPSSCHKARCRMCQPLVRPHDIVGRDSPLGHRTLSFCALWPRTDSPDAHGFAATIDAVSFPSFRAALAMLHPLCNTIQSQLRHVQSTLLSNVSIMVRPLICLVPHQLGTWCQHVRLARQGQDVIARLRHHPVADWLL